MTRALRSLAASSLLALAASCAGAVDASSPVVLAALDPTLLSGARTLVFSFSKTQTCADIVDLSPAEIGDVLEAAPENAPLQLLDPSTVEHVFGKVDPGVPIAYFVFASTKTDFDQRVAFGDLAGTVFAMGCRDFTAPSGTRFDLPLTLFPVGLR